MKDITKHIEEKHKMKIVTHAPHWYEVWGNRCPDCGAEAEFSDED